MPYATRYFIPEQSIRVLLLLGASQNPSATDSFVPFLYGNNGGPRRWHLANPGAGNLNPQADSIPPWGSALDAIRTHLRSTLNCDACGEVTWRSGGLAALVTDLELARTCDMVDAVFLGLTSPWQPCTID